jgi:hypothetical protein
VLSRLWWFWCRELDRERWISLEDVGSGFEQWDSLRQRSGYCLVLFGWVFLAMST